MEELMIGLLLTFISGITWIAYKHKKGYSKLFPYLIGFIFMAFTAITAYNLGVGVSYNTVSKLIDVEKITELNEAINKMKIPDITLFITYVISTSYFVFLKYVLPDLIEDEDIKK